jgi:hypothetical protein
MRSHARAAFRQLGAAPNEAWWRLAAACGPLLPRARPISAERSVASLGTRIAIFCHFDRKGRVAEHARRYVDALRAADLSIVFVTNAGRLEAEAREWLLERCAWVIVRPNRGLDFAAWRDALSVAGLPRPETELLLIANDSVYGPFVPVGQLLSRISAAEADVWGLTDSWQHRYHLQSYFLAFVGAALRSPAFASFWAEVQDLPSKTAVIRSYEVGLTQRMLDGGLRCRAVWSYVDLIAALHGVEVDGERGDDLRLETDRRNERLAARRVPLNPTAELWRPLLAGGFPFVKRELLRSNRQGVADVAAWLNVVRAASPVEADVILRDLTRSLRNLAP